MRRPRSLRAKLLAAVLLYVGLLAAVGLIGLYAAQASLGGLHVAVEHHVRELSLLSQISADVGLIRSTSLLHILSTSELERSAYEAQIAHSEKEVAALLEQLARTQTSFHDQEDADTVEAFRSAWREFLRVQDEQVLPLSRADRDQEALSVAQPDGPLDRAYQTAMLRLAALQATLPTESTERLDLAQRDFVRNGNVLLAVVALAAIVGIASGLAYSARLAAAVQTLAWAAGRVAAGDLGQRVRLRTGDELEALGTSFNVMTANLQRMTEWLNAQLREVGAANRALETEIAERRRTEAALRESEERLRLALSVGQMCTWEWDLGANTVVTSEPRPARADQPPGPERLELSGVLEGVYPADRARVEQALAEVCAGRRDELDVEYRVAHAEGQVCWRAAKGRVRRAADGRPAKVVGVLLDVTHQRQAEEERIALIREQAARAQAEEALRLHDQFLVVAAHELKTPITSLLASAQLIARQVERGAVLDPARLKDRVRIIDRQADKLARLVAQLVDVGRLEAGNLSLERTETDLTGLVQEVVDALQMQTPRHALVVRAPGRVGALVDPLGIEQVVTNLLDNAIKFSPGGGTVEVEVSAEAEIVRLAVSDPGIGIPPDRRGRIFQRFYQAHSDDHRSGMGLGLYLSRQIVERHGGHIQAEFPPQGGTRLVVTLPSGRVADGGPAEAAA